MQENDCWACEVAKPGRCPSHSPQREPEQLTLWVEDTNHILRPQHKIRGEIGAKGEYGQRHDMDCPGCQDTPFTLSPRSETYWAS